MKRLIVPLFCLTLSTGHAQAGSPRIIAVEATRSAMGWRIDVTMTHPDTGWDHYADGWEVVDSTGHRLGVRELMHPHVNEQPFTRSLRSVVVPDGIREVFIRARCSEDGWSGETFRLRLKP